MWPSRTHLPAVLLALLSLVSLSVPVSVHAAVKVGVSDWPGWVAWYIAEQKGFFKKHGVAVELVWFLNYTDSIQALSAGQLDANSQTWSDTMAPLGAGIPLKVILVNDNSAGNDAVMVKPEIQSFADLKGKNIALESFSISHFVLVTALSRNGLTPADVNVLNLSAGDAAAAFLGGRVDAAVVWNPWVNQIQTSGKGRALFTSKEMPGLIPDALVAQEKALRDEGKRNDFLGMIKVWYDTVAFIQASPGEAAPIMAKVVGLDPQEYAVFLPGTKFFGQAENLQAFGESATDSTTLLGAAPVILKFLKDNELIEAEVDPTQGIDGSLVKAVARQ